MKHILVPLFVLLIISTPGCSMLPGGQAGSSSGTPVAVERLRAEPCSSCSFTYFSGLNDPLQVAIRDHEAWREMWERIHSTTSPLPALPEIDFSREIIVVVAMGTRPSGGYGIVVDGARERDGRLEVIVRKQSPGRNCGVTTSLTQPVDVARLPRTKREVVFQEKEVIYDCK